MSTRANYKYLSNAHLVKTEFQLCKGLKWQFFTHIGAAQTHKVVILWQLLNSTQKWSVRTQRSEKGDDIFLGSWSPNRFFYTWRYCRSWCNMLHRHHQLHELHFRNVLVTPSHLTDICKAYLTLKVRILLFVLASDQTAAKWKDEVWLKFSTAEPKLMMLFLCTSLLSFDITYKRADVSSQPNP